MKYLMRTSASSHDELGNWQHLCIKEKWKSRTKYKMWRINKIVKNSEDKLRKLRSKEEHRPTEVSTMFVAIFSQRAFTDSRRMAERPSNIFHGFLLPQR